MSDLVKVKSVAVLPGVAPVPGIPAVPGHWETDYEQVAVSGGSVSSSAGVVPLPVGISNNTEAVIWFARYLGLSVVVPSGSSQSERMAAYNAAISARVGIFVVSLGPQYEYRPVSRWVPGVPGVPGIPGTPTVVSVDYLLGWNAGGSTAASLQQGRAEFSIGSVVGATVGLTTANESNDPREVIYGFQLANGIYRIILNGNAVGDAYPHTGLSRFVLERWNGDITWSVNGAVLHQAEDAVSARMVLDASLYAGGDAVRSPLLVHYQPAFGTSVALPAMASAGNLGSVKSGHAVLPALRSIAYASHSNHQQLPCMTSRGLGAGGVGHGVLPALRCIGGNSEASTPVGFAVGLGWLPPVRSLAEGKAYKPGAKGHQKLPVLRSAAFQTAPRGFATFQSLPSMRSRAIGAANDKAVIESGMMLASGVSGAMHFAVLLSSGLQVHTALGVTLEYSGQISSGVRLGSEAHATGTLQAVIASAIQMARDQGVILEDQDFDAWVINMRTNAISRYENYPFDSFAVVDGVHLAAGRDGLYALGGSTDAGTPIDSSVHFGELRLSSGQLKRLSNVYLVCASDKELKIRVQTGDGEDYVYTARRSDTFKTTQRVDTGRGLRAMYYELELLGDGADYEVDSVDVLTADTTRRI